MDKLTPLQVDVNQDLDFYREASLRMTSSLDMAEAVQATFHYLCRHFPLEGISLHQMDPVLKGHKLFFLITRSGFHHVERFLPLSDEEMIELQHIQKPHQVFNYPNTPDMFSVAAKHSHCIADILPFKQRGYLVSVLWAGNKSLGHLVFLGNGPACFDVEHERKQSLLVPHFSVAMANMLQFQRTLAFQQRLDMQKSELEEKVRQLRGQGLIGAQSGLRSVMDMVASLSNSETPILITGETGTGKEMIADAIQRISPRKNAPFVKVNCGAIPESLVDSELFGYQKGAFTGATSSRPGRFEQAHGGTLFLDEVGELPLQVQVRLLRVLQNHIVERLGSNTSIPVDIRIIAATNRNLETMLRGGAFREDLYYRLNVFPLHIPPLRERTEDIPALSRHFLEKLCARMKRATIPTIPCATLERLTAYTWPGNVRELENLVERALLLCDEQHIRLEQFLPQESTWYMNPASPAGQNVLEEIIMSIVTKELEKRLSAFGKRSEQHKSSSLDEAIASRIRAALTACKGKIHGPGGAGEQLGLNPNTLRKKMAKLGISRKEFTLRGNIPNTQAMPSTDLQIAGQSKKSSKNFSLAAERGHIL